MKDIEQILMNIRQKILEIADNQRNLLSENEELISQVLKLKEENEQLLTRITELENKDLNLHIGFSLDNSEKERLTNNIDKLLKEIDKSMELLKS